MPKRTEGIRVMFVVVDIDCTLYSYMELALSQRGFAFSLFRSVLSGRSQSLYENVDKTFDKYAPHIGKRMDFLIQFFGEKNLLFYSSYPLTDTKKSFFSSFPVKVRSCFPLPKTVGELKKIHSGPVNLVIGDRREDRELSRHLSSFWRGCPYYNFHHLLSGPSYTKAFISLVSKGFNPPAARRA